MPNRKPYQNKHTNTNNVHQKSREAQRRWAKKRRVVMKQNESAHGRGWTWTDKKTESRENVSQHALKKHEKGDHSTASSGHIHSTHRQTRMSRLPTKQHMHSARKKWRCRKERNERKRDMIKWKRWEDTLSKMKTTSFLVHIGYQRQYSSLAKASRV